MYKSQKCHCTLFTWCSMKTSGAIACWAGILCGTFSSIVTWACSSVLAWVWITGICKINSVFTCVTQGEKYQAHLKVVIYNNRHLGMFYDLPLTHSILGSPVSGVGQEQTAFPCWSVHVAFVPQGVGVQGSINFNVGMGEIDYHIVRRRIYISISVCGNTVHTFTFVTASLFYFLNSAIHSTLTPIFFVLAGNWNVL